MTKLKSLLKREQELTLKIQEEVNNLDKLYLNKPLTKVIYNRFISLNKFNNVSVRLYDYEVIEYWEQIKEDMKEYKQIPLITKISISKNADDRYNKSNFNRIGINVSIEWV